MSVADGPDSGFAVSSETNCADLPASQSNVMMRGSPPLTFTYPLALITQLNSFWIKYNPHSLTVASTSHTDRLTRYITEQRTAHRHDGRCGLGSGTWSAKGNIRICSRTSTVFLLLWDSQSDLLAICCCDKCSFFFGRRESSLNVAECDCVASDAE